MIIQKNNQDDELILREDKNYLKVITLDKNDIWLDAGSHIGGFALNIFDKVKTVIALEPDKKNFKLLMKNIKSNNILNIIAERKAIIHTDEKFQNFYLNKYKNTGMHSLLVKRGRDKIRVECININTLIEKYQINKIKMDIEGSEYEVLKTITDENYRKIKELIFEFHFKILADKKMEKYFKLIGLLERNFSIVNYPKQLSWTKVVDCHK